MPAYKAYTVVWPTSCSYLDISLKMLMESSKNGRWIIPFKKFSWLWLTNIRSKFNNMYLVFFFCAKLLTCSCQDTEMTKKTCSAMSVKHKIMHFTNFHNVLWLSIKYSWCQNIPLRQLSLFYYYTKPIPLLL